MHSILLLSGARHLQKPLQESLKRRKLNYEVYDIENKNFPDSEQYVRIPVEKGLPNILVQSMFNEPDKKIVETILATRTLKDLGIKHLTGFFTYLAYARQDRRIKEGEAVSQLIIVETLFKAGIDKVFVFDVHARKESMLYKSFDITNISCVKLFANYYSNLRGKKDLIVVSPDEGSYYMASELAKILEVSSGFCKKKRISGSEVKIGEISSEVHDRDVIIIDDIISTGNTMAEAIELVKNKGAKRVFISAVHGLFVGNAVDKLKSLGVNDIATTNTVMSEFAKVDISDLIVDEVYKLNKNGQS